MKGTIVITGAGGFTGRHACRYFAQQGLSVVAAVRREDGNSPAGQVYICDLTDRAQTEQLIRDTAPRYVLHLAGRNAVSDSWKDPLGCLESNVLSTLYLLEALRGKEACRVLIAGSMLDFNAAEDPRPLHPYSLAKTMQVLAARAWGHLYGQEVLIAKPSNLIGPGRSNGICGLLAKRIACWEKGLDAAVFRLSSLHEERDYLDVRDAVAAYSIILKRGEQGIVYPVCSGIRRSLGDIAEIYTGLASCRLPIEVGEAPPLPSPSPMDDTAMRELGWAPRISFQESLAAALDYYRSAVI